MKNNILWGVLMIALSACTSQQLYNHTQLQVNNHCNQKVGVEKEQCLDKVNDKTYEEYEKERQEVMKKK
jgi:hypothetical protein